MKDRRGVAGWEEGVEGFDSSRECCKRQDKGAEEEADLHKVSRVPVQLSKDDTLGSRQRDAYLQQ